MENVCVLENKIFKYLKKIANIEKICKYFKMRFLKKYYTHKFKIIGKI